MDVTLRPVESGDLALLFEFQRDPVANRMAAFTAADPEDRAAFDEHWRDLLADPATVSRAIVVDDENGPGKLPTSRVAGHVLAFPHKGQTEVTYWIDPALWSHGVASAALAHFLLDVTTRPLRARVVADNAASLRVLHRCGFTDVGTEVNFANARGADVKEILLELPA